MKKRLRRKLHGQSGESIAEVLVALLISAIALIMLAGMITTSTRVVTKSKTAMDNYIEEGNRLAARNGTYEEGSVSFKIGNDVIKLTDASDNSIDIKLYKNNSGINGGEVVAWTKKDP